MLYAVLSSKPGGGGKNNAEHESTAVTDNLRSSGSCEPAIQDTRQWLLNTSQYLKSSLSTEQPKLSNNDLQREV